MGQQLRVDTGDDSVFNATRQEAQVALTGEVHLIKTAPLNRDQAGVGLVQAALHAKHHVVAHINQIATSIELRRRGELRRLAQVDGRAHVRVQGLRRQTGQQQIRRR